MKPLLRIYANPLKQFFYLLIAAGFTVAGLWVLQDPTRVRANHDEVLAAYVAVVFSGLGTVVILYVILVYVVVRRPVLRVNEQGWRCNSPLLCRGQAVTWQDIGGVGIYRRNLRRNPKFYLVVHAKDPQRLQDPRALTFRTYFALYYPALWDTAVAVPLNTVFARTTPAKAEQLLGRIVTACAFEIQLYGVQVSKGIHDL